MVPLMERFSVRGIFDTGMYEYDTGLVLVTIRAAQSFFDLGENVTGVAVKTDDIYLTHQIADLIQAEVAEIFRHIRSYPRYLLQFIGHRSSPRLGYSRPGRRNPGKGRPRC